ncbi:MAG TPA: hypothetical protein VHD88_07190 [Pyrinomonadaceae bacterium]|nr:hypothetical protein [Pyrinomonadaceae bacterium]
MKPTTAKDTEPSALEDLGRATLQIVHDLKNRLNGIKLYATFLRKRLEREDRSPEERETLGKVITGLDRAVYGMGRATEPDTRGDRKLCDRANPTARRRK